MKEKVRKIIIDNFIDKDSIDDVTDDLGLISTGILDSVSVLILVDKLEDEFNIKFAASEIDRDKLDSINLITDYIQEKL